MDETLAERELGARRFGRKEVADLFAKCWRSAAGWVAGVERDDAEDILQDAFVSCVTSFPRTHPGELPTCAYFQVAVRNRIKDHRRSRGRAEQPTSSDGVLDGEDPNDTIEQSNRRSVALQALALMPSRAREVLVLSTVGFSNRDIASQLEMSESAVNGALYRARIGFRTALAELDPAAEAGWQLHGRKGQK